MTLFNEILWDENGLIPAIAQDAQSRDILMVAWMNREALAQTIATGEAVYFSRSRKRLWHKGEESGHTQKIAGIYLDCDGDVLLLQVAQTGGIACHTGRRSCFFRKLEGEAWVETAQVLLDPKVIYKKMSKALNRNATPLSPAAESSPAMSADIFDRLAATIAARRGDDAAQSYTASLFAKGTDTILKKVGEEATEFVIAAKAASLGGNKDSDNIAMVKEAADVIFHLWVALAERGLTPDDIRAELLRREGTSGHIEKAGRKAL